MFHAALKALIKLAIVAYKEPLSATILLFLEKVVLVIF